MLHPSYSELIQAINNIAGDAPLVEKAEGKKPLSIAVEELYNSKIKILGDDEEE